MKLHPTSLAAVVLAGVGGAWAQNKACPLATPAGLKASLGMKVAGLKESNMGPHPFVSARLPRTRVMLRLAKTSGQGGGKESAGIAAAKSMGARVEVKTFGPITCSTMIPPASLAVHGFNTTCSVVKNGSLAAI